MPELEGNKQPGKKFKIRIVHANAVFFCIN